jgi:hypothetical protein
MIKKLQKNIVLSISNVISIQGKLSKQKFQYLAKYSFSLRAVEECSLCRQLSTQYVKSKFKL